ncbi:MAG: hypothetical protein RR602_07990, partial [Longicatena sp.]
AINPTAQTNKIARCLKLTLLFLLLFDIESLLVNFIHFNDSIFDSVKIKICFLNSVKITIFSIMA